MRILCYGDSNTYGWHEINDGLVTRWPVEATWPYQLAKALGPQVSLEVDGLSGRTSAFDRPESPDNGTGSLLGSHFNGARYLPVALSRTMPVDLVILMLGTNDFNAQLRRSPEESAQGIAQCLSAIRNRSGYSLMPYRTPDVLLLSPPLLAMAGTPSEVYFPEADAKTQVIATHFAQVAHHYGVHFFDVAQVIPNAHDTDNLHLNLDDHTLLAQTLLPIVEGILHKREQNTALTVRPALS